MLVLLDRDGVINRDLPTGVTALAQFEMLPGAAEAIAVLTRAGYGTAVCTNQSAIGMGKLTEEGLQQIHAAMTHEIAAVGGRIDAIYHAPDTPEQPSTRRKPAPGMLLEALQQFAADPARTPFVGDMLRDLEAAAAAGCPRILTRTGKGAALEAVGIPAHVQPVTVVDDLAAAVRHILAHYAGA